MVMELLHKLFQPARHAFWSWGVGVCCQVVGGLVILGWLFDSAYLKSVIPGLPTMKLNAAVSFLLAGASLQLFARQPHTPNRRRAALLCAAAVGLIGLLTLLEYGLARNLGIDELLWRQPEDPPLAAPGRMSAITALLFLLLGSALLLLSRANHISKTVAQVLTCLTAIIPLIGIIRYLYDIHPLHFLTSFSAMALHTAVTGGLLCLGILLLEPDQGVIASFTGQQAGSVMARRLLPFVIAMPILGGWVRLLGQRAGYYDTIFGVVLLVISFIHSFSLLLWWNARSLNQMEQARMQAETDVRTSEERLRLATEVMQMGTWDRDLMGNRLFWSPSMERLMGFAPGTFPGTYEAFAQLVHPADQSTMLVAQQQARNNSGHYQAELRFVLPDGRVRWGLVYGQILFDEQGMPQRMVGVDFDITERKQIEEALRQSELRYRELAESLPQLVWTCVADGLCDYLSPQWVRYTGVPACVQLGYGWVEQLHPDDRDLATRNWEAAITSGKVFDQEFRIRRADGMYHWFRTLAVPIFDEQGRLRKWFGSNTDIEDIKQAQEKIEQLNLELEQRVARRTEELATANRELESFAYSVSHDLRAPLRAIDGFSRILLEDHGTELTPGASEYLQLVRANTQRMGQLIDDLLNLSRLTRQTFHPQRLDPTAIVQAVLAELAHEQQGRQIELCLEELPPCEADATLLKQVYVNLLTNALKFTQHRPVAVIRIGAQTPADGSPAIYFVQDNGVGFDMKYSHKLFQVFQRLHRAEDYEGTGVGLAIVQRIVQRHGGRIWVEAASNQGATFSFTMAGGITQ